MLDPKWYDISETTLNYLRKFASYPHLRDQTQFLTVHASNGKKALQKLMAEKVALWLKTKIFAVTALTSLDDTDTQAIFDETAKHSVLKLAKEALEAGVDGIVCSPKEAQILREVFQDFHFEIITPWVRFDWGETHDQKRVTTPADAIANGANHIVMGRPILESEDMKVAVEKFFSEIAWVVPQISGKYQFEKLLYTWEWLDLLKYIGAIYHKPALGAYCRLASKLLSDTYINIAATERNYLVIERACEELAQKIIDKRILANITLGAQMGSIRLSLYLAEKLGIEESIYTEKTWDWDAEMALKRHEIDFTGKRVILSEDIITKGTTLKKMIEIVKAWWGEVVGITCVGNRFGKDDFEGIPLISCFTPPAFQMYYDDETPLEARWTSPKLPVSSIISEKPKNDWTALVESMRSQR